MIFWSLPLGMLSGVPSWYVHIQACMHRWDRLRVKPTWSLALHSHKCRTMQDWSCRLSIPYVLLRPQSFPEKSATIFTSIDKAISYIHSTFWLSYENMHWWYPTLLVRVSCWRPSWSPNWLLLDCLFWFLVWFPGHLFQQVYFWIGFDVLHLLAWGLRCKFLSVSIGVWPSCRSFWSSSSSIGLTAVNRIHVCHSSKRNLLIPSLIQSDSLN